MKKKILSMVLAFAMILSTIPIATVSAADFSGDGWSFDSATGTLTITTNEGTTAWRTDRSSYTFQFAYVKSVIIQSGVTSIGEQAFRDCKSLTSITLPDSVTSIGNNAFSSCTSLTSIIIPAGVTSIGTSVFSGCASLTSIIIPAGVTNIGEGAFLSCTNLTSITIPDSVTSIGDFAFKFCLNLISITIPAGVTSIGEGTFSNCPNLTSIKIPDNVTSIGDFAFWDCKSLTSVTIPDGVISIGRNAFSFCTSLTSITLPDSVMSIGEKAFLNCTSLELVTIPAGVINIASYTFGFYHDYDYDGIIYKKIDGFTIHGVKGSAAEDYAVENGFNFVAISNDGWSFDSATGTLTVTTNEGTTAWRDFQGFGRGDVLEIIVEDNVTEIGQYAFRDCNNLTTITIGSGVTSIGSSAFSNTLNSSLTNIYVEPGNTEYSSINGILFNKAQTTIILYPLGKPETSYSIPDTVINIGGSSFSTTNLTSIIIPDNVTSIGAHAFNSSKLESVIIPDSVTVLESYAFGFCKDLTSVIFGNSVTVIGDYAFGNCTSLTSITIPDSVTVIHYNAFVNTAWLNNQPDGVVYAGKVAYKYKGDMPANTRITLRDGTKGIAGSAFSGYSNLASINIPDGVTHIAESAFWECTGLASLTIPDSVISVGGSAFWRTAWLDNQPNGLVYTGKVAYTWKGDMPANTSISLRDDTTGIAGNAFAFHKELISITIPDSVKIIGNWAFRETGLNSVTIPKNVTNIGYGAFISCMGLKSVTIPNSVTSIGTNAFGFIWHKAGPDEEKIEDFTIHGVKGSAAEDYANKHEFEFHEIDNHNTSACVVCNKYACTVRHGRIRGDDTPIGIGDSLEILMYIAKIKTNLLEKEERAMQAALITNKAKLAGYPTISDVLEILMYIAKIESCVLYKMYKK